MLKKSIKTYKFFLREDNKRSFVWKEKISLWIKNNFLKLKISEKNPNVIIALGGDGTILEATRTHQKSESIIFGLNLGHVGFLASVREEKDFFVGLKKLFSGKFEISERVMFGVDVIRKGKKVFSGDAINEVVIQNLLSVVDLMVSIDGHPIQFIRGTGVMVSTPTGSTAYNLSAHGPIVSPDIKCLIVTEILDHNIPTPSLVINPNKKILIKVLDFRKNNVLKLINGEWASVLLSVDGEKVFPLKVGDKIVTHSSNRVVKFAEIEKNYFMKSLQEKFAFK